jgi:hypothetical protein
MKRQAEHERRVLGTAPHLVELVDQHIGMLGWRMPPTHDGRLVVELDRVRYGQDSPSTSLHPERLLVAYAPVIQTERIYAVKR